MRLCYLFINSLPSCKEVRSLPEEKIEPKKVFPAKNCNSEDEEQ